MSDRTSVTPVILSGGAGSRLWPLSRTARPKQFLDLTGGGTMLELTLDRVSADAGFGDPVIVCNASHAEMVVEQSGGRHAAVILEPAARNTAPAIALAALTLPATTLMLVMPSDHIIADVPAFHRAIDAAVPFAEQGWLMTFGVKPDAPETGYGYIRCGTELGEGVHQVERFVEKPTRDVARAYLEDGSYCWNAGIFLFRAGDYMSALAQFAPDMLTAANDALASAGRTGRLVRPDHDSFARSPSESIDYAVMEKAQKVAVVPVDIGWCDIGSWDALYDRLEKDENDNVLAGDVVDLASTGCLIRTDGPLVTVSGVENLIVVATRDAVMILPRGSSQDTKKIVEELKGRDHPVLNR